ncbi:Elongation factor methyltransferase 6 [Hyphodiscus hymeniophilus]|uniref:Elongation factor methyltransferase 6 n=1 Tax=Hyphodiscus hymeniophilus TaxID=353542 RepID=A0A9P6SQC1_9HELO|nr:Elongation factor methyltransferase 6 [Hyphodiscus hymeniophilus]
MFSHPPSPEFSPLAIGQDFTPLPTYKAASTTSINFSDLLEPSLKLHEDLKSGCGGQLWPAGMVLAQQMLRLELGAGGGLVGLGVALGCTVDNVIYLTDQENMLSLMVQNINLNALQSQEIVQQKPNIILAADCVYFEPAFPLLLTTLQQLLDLCEDAVIYFCFKKRRRADMLFMRKSRKMFVVQEIEDVDREKFSREGLFLYTFRRKA